MSKNSRFLQPLATLVAAGSSVRSAVAEVGCSERQGYLLASTNEFRDMVAALRTESIQQASAILASGATKAARALVKLLDSDDEKVVLAAATKLMAIMQPVGEYAELRSRIDAIENGSRLRVVK